MTSFKVPNVRGAGCQDKCLLSITGFIGLEVIHSILQSDHRLLRLKSRVMQRRGPFSQIGPGGYFNVEPKASSIQLIPTVAPREFYEIIKQ